MIMKTLRYIALAALTLSFAACEQEDINPAVQGDPDAVKINATIGAMQTRVAYSGDNGVTNFVNGDAIKVVNLMRTSKNEATYTTTDGTNWTTTDAMVWNSSSKNKFQAYYPVAEYSSYDTFTIPTDQSDATKLASADWMTASTGEIDKPGNGVLDLNFQHRLAKVTVNLTFSSQYPEGYQHVSDFTFYTNEETQQAITALANSETSYTAILRPGEYADESYFIYLMMDDIDEHYVLGKTTTSAINFEAGKHYTFTLKVGKDVVSIDDVTVADWNEEEIDGGVAEEVPCVSSIDETTLTLRVSESATSEEITSAVSNALDAGCTTLNITLPADAPAEMITAIRRAICDTDGVADGSIHLTLKGVTTIPGTTNWDGVAFGPRNAQWDENGVEIVSHEEVTQLASVNLPDVTAIGAQAFLGCSNLTSITAPKVQSIGDWGLQGTAITSIDMPLLKEARYSAFCRTALTEVSLPSLETAGVIVFGHCKQLRTVDLPKLQNLSQQLFTSCTSLVSVSAPAATSMGINVFKGCSELVSITLQGVTELTNEAFAECTKLENITLGSVITNVNVNLFGGEALSSGITLTLHPDQANAEGDLKATAGTNVEWGGFTWKEVKFSATE